MKSRICLTLIALMICSTSAFAVKWAWDDGGVEYDGSMTVDGQSFTTDPTNPTLGANTSSQPPIVVVQSTTGDSFDCASMPVCSMSNYGTEPVCRVPGVTPALCTHRTDLGENLWGNYNGDNYSGYDGGANAACARLGEGWRLPTSGELNSMYLNKAAIGGFGSGYYWSGTENNYNNAWYQRFSDGNQGNNNKGYTYGVRCARRF